MTTLNDSQKLQVSRWLGEGLQPAEIQKRLATELDVRLTYLELKLLLSELQLVPKDREPAAPAAPVNLPGKAPAPAPTAAVRPGPVPTKAPAPDPVPAAPKAGVSVTVDQLTRPGALVSGGVTFSDGKRAAWYVDEMGRLSVAPAEQGYRPSAADMEQFQLGLERELARAGF